MRTIHINYIAKITTDYREYIRIQIKNIAKKFEFVVQMFNVLGCN